MSQGRVHSLRVGALFIIPLQCRSKTCWDILDAVFLQCRLTCKPMVDLCKPLTRRTGGVPASQARSTWLVSCTITIQRGLSTCLEWVRGHLLEQVEGLFCISPVKRLVHIPGSKRAIEFHRFSPKTGIFPAEVLPRVPAHGKTPPADVHLEPKALLGDGDHSL